MKGRIRRFIWICRNPNRFFNYLVADGMARRRNIGYDTSALRADSEPEFVEWTAEVAMELLTFQPQLPPRGQLPGAKQYSQSQLPVGSRRQNHRRMASLRVTVTTRNVTLVESPSLRTFLIILYKFSGKKIYTYGILDKNLIRYLWIIL